MAPNESYSEYVSVGQGHLVGRVLGDLLAEQKVDADSSDYAELPPLRGAWGRLRQYVV